MDSESIRNPAQSDQILCQDWVAPLPNFFVTEVTATAKISTTGLTQLCTTSGDGRQWVNFDPAPDGGGGTCTATPQFDPAIIAYGPKAVITALAGTGFVSNAPSGYQLNPAHTGYDGTVNGPSANATRYSFKTFDPTGSGSGTATAVRSTPVIDGLGGLWSVDDTGRVSHIGAMYGDPKWRVTDVGTGAITIDYIPGQSGAQTQVISICDYSPITPYIVSNTESGVVTSVTAYLVDRQGYVYRITVDKDGIPSLDWRYEPTTAQRPTYQQLDDNLHLGNPPGDNTVPGPNQRVAGVVLGTDGSVYAALLSGYVIRLSAADGALLNEYNAGSPIVTTPARDSSGNLYVGTMDGRVIKLSSTLSQLWSYSIPGGAAVLSSPAINSQGHVIVAAGSTVYKLRSTNGNLLWSYTTGGTVVGSPALNSTDRVHIGSTDGFLYKLASSDGHVIWTFPAGSPIRSSVLLDAGDEVYFGTDAGQVYRVRTNGTQKWVTGNLGGAVRGGLSLSGDGALYTGVASTASNIANVIAIGSALYNVTIPVTLGDYSSNPATWTDGAGNPYVGDVTQHTITVEFRTAGSLSTSAPMYVMQGFLSSPSNPTITVPNVPAGTYDVYVKAKHWLRKKIANVTINSNVTLAGITLTNGDVNNDNAVNDTDRNLVLANLGNPGLPPDSDNNTDLDGDGFCNNTDLTIVDQHNGMVGD